MISGTLLTKKDFDYLIKGQLLDVTETKQVSPDTFTVTMNQEVELMETLEELQEKFGIEDLSITVILGAKTFVNGRILRQFNRFDTRYIDAVKSQKRDGLSERCSRRDITLKISLRE